MKAMAQWAGGLSKQIVWVVQITTPLTPGMYTISQPLPTTGDKIGLSKN